MTNQPDTRGSTSHTSRRGDGDGPNWMMWVVVAIVAIGLILAALFWAGVFDVDVDSGDVDVDIESPDADLDVDVPDVDIGNGDVDVEDPNAEADVN